MAGFSRPFHFQTQQLAGWRAGLFVKQFPLAGFVIVRLSRQGAMMQVPLDISFHNFDNSEWAKEEIRDQVAKLEALYERMTSCRVRVDQRADNSNHTIPPVVRIEIGIPGRKDVVVAHEPDRLQRKFQRPDLHNAINEAFRLAELQLSELKRKMTDHAAAVQHEALNEFRGQVAEMRPAEDFGFLLNKEGGLLYFHRNALLSGEFDKLRRGDEVSYVEEVGDTGPIATKVRVKEVAAG
jgi:cold shock CspA family protein/ribosome-associated translation inhibitor RaiA